MVRADARAAPGSDGSARPGRLAVGIAGFLFALAWLSPGTAAADEQSMRGPTQDQSAIPQSAEPLASEGPTPWLDEVRAQRRSWEEKRDAARSAYEARRRANNPKAAAQQEAWEEDVQRRRQARRERLELERELYRGLGPSLAPAWPWPNDPAYDATRPPELADPFAPSAPPDAPVFAPQGWDNHWYFQGF